MITTDHRITRYQPTLHTDSWSLRVMREAKAERDATGTPIPELDAYLAQCEAAAAEVGVTSAAREQATAEAREQAEAFRPGRGGNGATRGTANPPSEAQLRFIASLARDLGRELETPRDKRHASLIIDAAKRELDQRRRSGATPAARQERPATERQVAFLDDLLNERAHSHGELDPTSLSAAAASALITELMAAPRAAVAAHGIREGRYAYTTDGGATADHYRVRRDGKIVVWTAGGEYPYNGKLNAGLEWIKANPREAAELFGRLTETCGRCGRDLSDDDSRARGLGPVCAGKSEW